MTHTPGPWNFARAVKPGANEENNHLIYNGEKRHIAEVFQYQEHDFIIELAEASANARLIAAAPELLEALKEIAKGEGPYSMDRLTHANNTIENMIAIAQQAIAKAEGGE